MRIAPCPLPMVRCPSRIAHCPVLGPSECAERFDDAWWTIGLFHITPVYAVASDRLQTLPGHTPLKQNSQNQHPAGPRAAKKHGQGPVAKLGQCCQADSALRQASGRLSAPARPRAVSCVYEAAAWPGGRGQGRGYQCGGVGSLEIVLCLAGMA